MLMANAVKASRRIKVLPSSVSCNLTMPLAEGASKLGQSKSLGRQIFSRDRPLEEDRIVRSVGSRLILLW
jgi:hypothetical protein